MDGVFSGKKALVVGGSGGIGKAVALGLGALGAAVTVHGGSSRQRLKDTVEAIREAGGQAEGFLCKADRPGAARRILTRLPDPDILICGWGPFLRRPLEKMTGEDWLYLVSCNLALPGTLVSLVLEGMIRKKWGRILLFGGSNTDTIRPFSTTAAYSAAKTALGVLAKSTAKAAGAFGVTCNVICPGLTDTEYCTKEEKAYNQQQSPGGKALSPGEIAAFALETLKNPRINGAIIPLDNGLCL